MVRLAARLSLVFFFASGVLFGQKAVDPKIADPSIEEHPPEGPTLYGDGGGRLWKWQGGEKIWLSPEGRNFVLGGVGSGSLWGWSLEAGGARFFSMALPKKKDAKAPKDSKDTKGAKEQKNLPPPEPVFDAVFPAPELADRRDDRTLLVWNAHNQPRYEVWKAGQRLAARAWDDGRSVYAVALGPEEGWIIAGRTSTGEPWLEVSGSSVPAPEGWRGRLTVAAWMSSVPVAAGWGAPGAQTPRPLFWGADGWVEPAPPEKDADSLIGAAPATESGSGVYPLLGSVGEKGLLLAGWQADSAGVLRPWFWNGEASVPGGAADGLPQAFSSGDKGAFLVVRHQAVPWFTIEDGVESKPLEGFDGSDRVVAVEPEAPSP